MSDLHFICWKWRSRDYKTEYLSRHVNVLGAMLERHCREDHRLVCVTDDPIGVEHDTHPLWSDMGSLQNPNGPNFPSCYRRLKIFSRETLDDMGIREGDRVVSVDLDVVLVDDVTPLFRRDDPFVGWRGVGRYNPEVYNGTLFMFRAGQMEHLWTQFDPAISPLRTRAAKYFGSDQAWLSFMLAGKVAGWGCADGVYSYSRDMSMNPARGLEKNARLVSFNGKRKPWDEAVMDESPWIADHWRM